jgi:hypothetical protein
MTDQLILVPRVSRDTVQSLAQIYARYYGNRDDMEKQNALTAAFMSNQDFQKVCDIAVNIQTGAYGTQLKLEF